MKKKIKLPKNKINNQPKVSEFFAPKMDEAYDSFLKQMGGSVSTGNPNPCGPICEKNKCRVACRMLCIRMRQNKN